MLGIGHGGFFFVGLVTPGLFFSRVVPSVHIRYSRISTDVVFSKWDPPFSTAS
jgi:hypothetical protein